MSARRQAPEYALHLAVAKYLNLALPTNAVWFHPPNGGLRSKTEAGRFRAMGVMAGLPDIGIIYQGRIVWLELKAPKGRVSATQAWCHRHLEHAGSPVYLCWGVDDVEAVLWEHMPLRAQVPV